MNNYTRKLIAKRLSQTTYDFPNILGIDMLLEIVLNFQI